ncbi:hypothetical protein PV325_010930 [Microctonus aethiopoides]|uniref:DUF1907 domain-containing protein n=1 Tax=Microctonus aethiopoides TaxID=144406 RepID=A0AA39FWJ5_9HYME|nr:hypothetical protein PV325_010930 [Microctonus aethiopoides]KAK0176851.1 hypothetical protein PV328_000953 [Microctonus aethiopoides]
MSSMDANLKITERKLFTPTLEQIKDVISLALLKNFAEVSVEIVECPDLTKAPFTLAASGLGSTGTLIEIGGPAFLLPLAQKDKIYDIQYILKQLNFNENAFVIGAGAGPWPQLSRNCEMMMNLVVSPSELKNETRLAWVGNEDHCVLQKSERLDTRFAILANLYVSQGECGRVLKVHVKKRIGKLDFIATMQNALATHYKNQLVGLGGTFMLKNGKAKQHVMPDFSTTPLTTEKSLNEWLHFYEMAAPLIAVGTFVSSESDLDLRPQHFHSYGNDEGGHYHIDTTPETAEYLGYFNIANDLYRIDQPLTSVDFGKD